MRDIWFISDTHFGHQKVIPYCRPHFDSVEQMEECIVSNWNDHVKPQDLVYHLGDFAWTPKDAKRVRPKLNGAIRLIVGNHDDIPALCAAGMFQRVQMWRQFSEIGVTASHVPMRREQIRHGAKNVHGHVHGKIDGLNDFHFDVSVESTNYRPVHYDVIAAWAGISHAA